MALAALSLWLYEAEDIDGLDLQALWGKAVKRHSVFTEVPGTHLYASFTHLYGHAAGYHSYVWSLVIARDVFSAFQKAGLLDEATARRSCSATWRASERPRRSRGARTRVPARRPGDRSTPVTWIP